MLDEFEEELKKTFIKTKKIIISVVLLIIFLVLFLMFNPFVIIKAGERGVVLNWGAVSDKIFNEGIHFRIPIMQKIAVLDVKTVKHEVKSIAYSKDIQTVDATIALNYRLKSEDVNKLWQEIGKDYEMRIIDPAIQESIKATTAKFTAQDLIEKRNEVKDEIKKALTERLFGRYIIVEDFSIVNFDFSDAYEIAVEAKQVAQQSALKAENDLKRIEVEAEQRVAQAKAEAEAIKIQAESISAQGGAEYVNLKAIEKWNGALPTYTLGNSVPFVNINK